VSYELPDEGDSEIRKRAAWLLGMLALVAALFVGIMITFVGNSGGGGNNNAGPVGPTSSTPGSTSKTAPTSSAGGSTTSQRPTSSAAPSTSAVPRGSAGCPTSAKCALTGDIGNAVAAVNAYRTQHGKPALPGTIAADAAKCALTDGSDCPDSYAESQVPGPNGTTAVAKVESLAKLLDPAMKSFGVGWAYDPASKTYYFAVVRNH
jgi:hypothetical protein